MRTKHNITAFQQIPVDGLDPETIAALRNAGRQRVLDMLADLIGQGKVMLCQASLVYSEVFPRQTA